MPNNSDKSQNVKGGAVISVSICYVWLIVMSTQDGRTDMEVTMRTTANAAATVYIHVTVCRASGSGSCS